MSLYRYYLPKTKPTDVTDSLLASLGLTARLRDCLPGRRRGERVEIVTVASHGPDGGSGSMIVPQRRDRAGVPTLKMDRCESHKSLHGDYWICWDREDPPTPEGLERWEQIDGEWCELGDGRPWHCPTIRTCVVSPRVPQRYSQLNGELKREVLAQYHDAWERSAAWSVRLLDEYRESPIVSLLGLEGAIEAAIVALGVNYRVSIEEASLLGILTDDSLDAIIGAAVDSMWFHDITSNQKKTELWSLVSRDLRSSLHGPADSSPDTNPAEQTLNS